MKTELTPEDKQRLHDFIDKLGWPNDGTAEHNDMMKVAEYATIYEREQQAKENINYGDPEHLRHSIKKLHKEFTEQAILIDEKNVKIQQLEAERSEVTELINERMKDIDDFSDEHETLQFLLDKLNALKTK